MKRYIFPPSILLALLFTLILAKNQGYILWIQGSTNTSILNIVWLLFLGTIFIEFIYLLVVYKSKLFLIYILFLSVITVGSLWLEISSVTTRTYYEQNNHQILVVNNKRVLSGDIKFYYKDNLLFSKEITSCGQNLSLTCNYYIEDDNLIIELSSHGDIEERIVLIPVE